MECYAPPFIYGTAWKEAKTAELTETALMNGFAAVDTANFPTAYDEPLTGDGISAALKSGIKRSDLFIQTKFTPAWAHEKGKIPFDANQSIEGQIKQSVKQSLEHLKVEFLDALLLHTPFEDDNDNLVAWKIFESFVPHTIRSLGVSNFTLVQLEGVYANATIKPTIVQNRFYRGSGFDFPLRKLCAEYGIVYQAF